MAGRGWFLTAFALVALLVPGAVQGQQQTATAPTMSEAEIRKLAELHVELNVARDELNNAIAAIHEIQAQQEARDEYNNKRAEILETHGSTELDYQQKIFNVSTNGEMRAVFDRLVREVAEGGGPAQ